MEDPITQATPEPRPALPLRGSRDLFDINILPDRFRRNKLTLMVLLPWLLLAILLGTIYPVYTLANKAQSSFQEKRLALARVQAELDFYQINSQEREELQTQLDDALAQKDTIVQSYGGLQLSTYKWSPTLAQINQQLPEGVSWVQVSQQDKTIRLNGIAREYPLVLELLDSLDGLEGLADVEIDSIEQIDLEDIPENLLENEADALLSSVAPPTYYRFTILARAAGEVQP